MQLQQLFHNQRPAVKLDEDHGANTIKVAVETMTFRECYLDAVRRITAVLTNL